jgi:hypothetical protein
MSFTVSSDVHQTQLGLGRELPNKFFDFASLVSSTREEQQENTHTTQKNEMGDA